MFRVGFVLAMITLAAIPYPTGTIAAQPRAVPYIVIDKNAGTVLASNRPFERWYPASLTKLMTVYVALQAIEAGEMAVGSPVKITAEAARQPPSRMGYAIGTDLRADTALKILVVKSANDVAVALAQSVAGSTAAFVARMNEQATRLGMRDSHFANPHGLHDSGQFASARDLAVLARRILIDFPDFASVFAIPALRSGETIHYSYNLLLERFPGADGMKTGFVCASGYNMVASATRDGRQLIAVVLGTFSQTDRAVLAAELIAEGFAENGDTTIEQFRSDSPAAAPRSQRQTMCSETARQSRYDPGAGNAAIDAAILSPRRKVREPVAIQVGGVDAPPSEAVRYAQYLPNGNVPVPTPRPQYVRLDIDGLPITDGRPSQSGLPVPTPRPR